MRTGNQPLVDNPAGVPLAMWVTAWGARAVLAGLFFYSGFVKAGASEEFMVTLAPFTFVPADLVESLAMFLPWFEVVLAVCLLIPRATRWAAFATVVLMALFTGVLTWALANGIVVACGCFGSDPSPAAWKMMLAIARDVLIGAVALWLALRHD
jgi:uncharacterized membrane protein YphA (DoxX/SURF4 family)